MAVLTIILIVSGCGGNNGGNTTPEVKKGDLTGTVVTKSNGEAIPGASIKVKEETLTAETDIEGKFSLTDLEYGSYTLIVSKKGFVENTETFKIDESSETVTIELGEKVEASKQIVTDFTTAMNNVGQIYSTEEQAINNDIQEKIMPFFQAMSSELENLALALDHLEVLGNEAGPGTYTYALVERELASPTGEYTQDTSDSTGSQNNWTWTVDDTDAQKEITYVGTDIQARTTRDSTNPYYQTVDLTGITLTCSVGNTTFTLTTPTEAEATNVVTYTFNDGEYTTEVTVALGTFGNIEGTLTDPSDATNEIKIAADMNLEESDSSKRLYMNGSFDTPVINFTGTMGAETDSTTTTINTPELVPNKIDATGTLTTNTSTITGDVKVLFDTQKILPHTLTLNGRYLSDKVDFDGNLSFEWLNYKTYNPDGIKDENNFFKGEMTVDGSLKNLETDESYAADFLISNPSYQVIETALTLSSGSTFEITGNGAIDIASGDIDIKFTDANGITIDIDTSQMDSDNVVGSITNKDGVKVAKIKLSDNLNSLNVIYNDGTTITIPFNPLQA